MKSAQFLFFFLSLFLSDIVFCQSTASDQISEKPLKGKTILVTAPSNYAIRLAQRFENEGAKVVSIPAVETFINPNTKSIDRIFEQLEHIDWIILPSRKAIDAFFLRAAIYQEHTLSNTKFCAIGNDINYLKEKYKINVAFTPEESGPNGIVEALSKQKNIQGQKIAIVAPKVIGVKEPNVIPNLIKNLKTLGYHVEKAEGYITQIANKSKYEKELALLKKGSIDLIAFTSTAEIEALIKLSAVHSIDKTTVTCFGPYTGNNAKLLGLHPEYIGDNYHSFDDFVNGILNYLSEEKRKQ